MKMLTISVEFFETNNYCDGNPDVSYEVQKIDDCESVTINNQSAVVRLSLESS